MNRYVLELGLSSKGPMTTSSFDGGAETIDFLSRRPGPHGRLGENAGVHDFFDPQWIPKMRASAAQSLEPHVNDTNLVGVFTSNEVWWGSYLDEWPVVFRESDTMLLRYLNLSATAGGRADAVGWLSQRYAGAISALNAAWHINASSFESIASEMPFMLPSEARVNDEHAYMVRVATYYFSQVHAAVRAVDTNHLILGTRYAFLEMPYSVVTAEAPYTDVTSYNGYLWVPGLNITTTVRKVRQASGKPIIISEFGFRAFDNGSDDWNLDGDAGYPVKTQADRSAQLKSYLSQIMALPFVVGYHHWKLVDDPAHACENKGGNSNYGFVTATDADYALYQEAAASVGTRKIQLHLAARDEQQSI